MYLFLGFFRFGLATCVLITHTSLIYDLEKSYVNLSALGVWLFFVVSGFVIFSAHDNFYRGRTSSFLLNRALRMYPTLWVCLTISIILIWLNGGASLGDARIATSKYEWSEVLMSYSIIGGFLSNDAWQPLSPGFTLTIEFEFYLAAATLFWVAQKNWVPENVLFLAAGIAAAVIYVFIDATGSQYRFFGTGRFGCLFALGASLYVLHRDGWHNVGAIVIGLLSLCLSIHFVLSHESSVGFVGLGITSSRIYLLVGFVLLIVIMCLLLRIEASLAMRRVDKILGDLTYPLYLIQTPVIALLLEFYQPSGLSDWLLTVGLCVAASALIHHAVEWPLKSLRDKVRQRRLAAGAATSPTVTTTST